MQYFKTITATLILGLLMTFTASAQEANSSNKKASFSVEIDPMTFGFKGYGFHLRMSPKNSDHLLLGLGAYAMDFPSVLVDLNKKNKDQGWSTRLNQGYGLFAEHHFTEVNKKWFVGGQLAIQEYKIENETTDGSEKFSNFLLMAYTGYTWQPFDFNLYIKPWMGIGYTSKVTGENVLGGKTYDIAPILMFATLHVGYTF